uniref:Putative cytochrome P450 n=1 Tax=Moniliophthora roreri TaxID=221103 RepID=A0A0W0G923_MONRR
MDFHLTVSSMLGTISLSVIYGISAEPIEKGDPFIATANRAMDGFNAAAIPGRFLVDFLPALKYIPSWLPGAGFRTRANIWREDLTRMINDPFDATQQSMKTGEQLAPSFVSYCMANEGEGEDKKSLVKHAAASLLVGGTDTTVTAMHSFFLAMVCNPDVQVKAQCELDAVVGSDRLPDYEDLDSLPYVRAVVHEVLRWQPVTPLGPLRCTTNYDVYRGYYIPKGCTVVANVWAFLHDESTYGPYPETFNPDRWLTERGDLNPDIPEPLAQFGYGRRKCPGEHIAMTMLYIGVASVLHAFHIKKAVDERGNEVTPTQEYLSMFQNRPADFSCVVKIRSRAHEQAIWEATAVE